MYVAKKVKKMKDKKSHAYENRRENEYTTFVELVTRRGSFGMVRSKNITPLFKKVSRNK